MIDIESKHERAITITVIVKGGNRELALEHMDELAFLAKTAGAEIVEKFYQELPKPNRATAIGKGKAQEIKEYIESNDIEMAVFDDDLSPAQVRNLEKIFTVKVLDRSGIILDIFSVRAKTTEAKTQVELARLQYLLPRLTRMWTHLSKQHGGIGTKGPGETQIETDRRIVRERIQALKGKLRNISSHQELLRRNREKLPGFALVGYTNSGKSTLMNTLAGSDLYVEDELFATLDTTVRSFALPDGRKCLLSDTVGFIRKLPTHLIASFRSTLAEAAEADYLIHVVDIAHDHFREHIEVVNETLKSLNINPDNALLVFNKIDKLDGLGGIQSIKLDYPNSFFISAKRGINIPGLLDLLQRKYDESSKAYKVLLPYSASSQISKLFDLGDIIGRQDNDTGSEFIIKVQNDNQEVFNHLFGNYIID